MEINDVLLKLGSFATDIFPFRKAPFLLGVQKSVHHRVVNTKHTLAIFSEREKTNVPSVRKGIVRQQGHIPMYTHFRSNGSFFTYKRMHRIFLLNSI